VLVFAHFLPALLDYRAQSARPVKARMCRNIVRELGV
jgi:hypothetical protein